MPADATGLRAALLVAAVATLPLSLIQVQAAAVRGLGHVVLGDLPFSALHPTLLIGVFLAAALWLGLPARADVAMASYLAASLAALAWLWPMLRRRLPVGFTESAPIYRRREWLTTASAMILTAGFVVVLNQSSVMMLGAMAGPTEAGLLGAAARVAQVMQIIVFALLAAISPMIARLYAAGEMAALQQAIDVGVLSVFALGVAVATILALLGGWVLGLFGPAFVAAHDSLLVLLAPQLVCTATAAAAPLLNMTGHQNATAVILAAAACLNVALCGLLIPAFGILGAAAATAVSMAGSNVVMAVYARRVTGLRGYASPWGIVR